MEKKAAAPKSTNAKTKAKTKTKPAAPAKPREKATEKQLFTIRIEPALVKELEKLANKRKVTIGSIIRDQMASYVERNKKLGRM